MYCIKCMQRKISGFTISRGGAATPWRHELELMFDDDAPLILWDIAEACRFVCFLDSLGFYELTFEVEHLVNE